MKLRKDKAISGWIGSILLSACALPQMVQVVEQGHAIGLNIWFLLSWFIGELFMSYGTWHHNSWPLRVNHFVNIVALIVILFYYFTGN